MMSRDLAKESLYSVSQLHSFEANWSILKFATGSRKLLIVAFSVALLHRTDQISLLLLNVHMKDL